MTDGYNSGAGSHYWHTKYQFKLKFATVFADNVEYISHWNLQNIRNISVIQIVKSIRQPDNIYWSESI